MRERWRDDNMHSILVSDSVEEARRRAVALVYVLFLVLLILTLTATYLASVNKWMLCLTIYWSLPS